MIEYVLAVSVSFLFSAIYDLWKNERLGANSSGRRNIFVDSWC